MIAATMKTLKKQLDNICDNTAIRIVEFAEAECDLGTDRGKRILISKVEDALKFCCHNRGVLRNYQTITEARKARGLGEETESFNKNDVTLSLAVFNDLKKECPKGAKLHCHFADDIVTLGLIEYRKRKQPQKNK